MLFRSARLWLKEFKNKQFYLKPIGVTHIRFRINWRGFPGGSVVKNPSANAEDTGSIPDLPIFRVYHIACEILVLRPGIEPVSPALADGFFTTEPPGKPKVSVEQVKKED